MRVLSKPRLHAFWQQHPPSETPLMEWYRTALKADWNSIQEIRRSYPHADAVKLENGLTVTIFNIGGSKYRLITVIIYPFRRIYVKLVLTHRAYDDDSWKDRL